SRPSRLSGRKNREGAENAKQNRAAGQEWADPAPAAPGLFVGECGIPTKKPKRAAIPRRHHIHLSPGVELRGIFDDADRLSQSIENGVVMDAVDLVPRSAGSVTENVAPETRVDVVVRRAARLADVIET